MSLTLLREDKALGFMRSALFNAHEFSKDPARKVGALILNPKTYEVRSTGYNGMPRGCDDNHPDRLIKPEKLLWFEHAERNAIYNAARIGTPLEGNILISTMFPCADCARGIVQAGIEGVIALRPQDDDTWLEQYKKSQEIFDATGVKLELIERDLLIESANPLLKEFFIEIFKNDR